MRRFPVVTFAVLAIAAVVSAWPPAIATLVYDRNQILSGEVWRIIACNWVHFSGSHLAYNFVAFAIAGSLIELRGHPGLGWLCFLCSPLIGSVVFLTQPHVEFFGGLSGLATAAIVFLCLHGLHDRSAWRWVCFLGLAGIALKITFEFATGDLAFAESAAIPIKPMPESHIAGTLTALICWCRTRAIAEDLPETRADRAIHPN
jgi:rhomboid family GlyGly-CTERM serine protease